MRSKSIFSIETMVFRRVGVFMGINLDLDHTVNGPTNVGVSSIFGARIVLDPNPGQVRQHH